MTPLRSGAVLVADDHSLYRVGLSLLLKDRLGFRAVIEAPTFDAALDRLAETPNVALALFDLAMPGITGPESLSVVKETYPGLRVAIVSGSEERENVLKAVATGLNGYVSKSLTDDEILGAIQDILDGRIYVPRFHDVDGSDFVRHADHCGGRCCQELRRGRKSGQTNLTKTTRRSGMRTPRIIKQGSRPRTRHC